MMGQRSFRTVAWVLHEPAADHRHPQSFAGFRKPSVFSRKVEKKLCRRASFFRPIVTKTDTFLCELITIHQSFCLPNNVLSKRCGFSKPQCVALLQLVARACNSLQGGCDSSDLVFHVRQDEMCIGANHRSQRRDCGLSFVEVGIQRDLRTHRVILAFPMAFFRLFECKSKCKPSCCSCSDSGPSVPIDGTRSAEPPALGYSIKHRHYVPSLLEPILP